MFAMRGESGSDPRRAFDAARAELTAACRAYPKFNLSPILKPVYKQVVQRVALGSGVWWARIWAACHFRW